MARSWTLVFEFPREGAPSIEAVVAALDAAFGAPLELVREPWGGDPRDGYYRRVRARSVAGDAAPSLWADVALEASRDRGDPEYCDTSSTRVILERGSVAQREALWRRLADALAPLGGRDLTLAWTSAPIVDDFAELGAHERVASLRAAVTAALIERIASGPAHWPITVVSSRADDLDAVLRAAPAPEQVHSILLEDCALTALPASLLEVPARFAALTRLELARNQLRTLPLLSARLPGLKRLVVTGNPLEAPLDPAAWPGVQIVG